MADRSVVHQTRIPAALKRAFKERCDELSISEAAGTRIALSRFAGVALDDDPKAEITRVTQSVDTAVDATTKLVGALREIGAMLKK